MKSFGDLAGLTFHFVWLTGWTLGVCVIQGLLVGGGIWPLLLFMVTHGGAEYYTLNSIADIVKNLAGEVEQDPVLELEHGGVRAVWQPGSGSLTVALVAGVMGLAIHAALWGSLGYALVQNPGVFSGTIALACAAAWSLTGWRYAEAVWAHLKWRGEIVLQADLDVVVVTHAGSTVSRQESLPLAGMTLLPPRPDDLTLELYSGDRTVSLPITRGPATDELVSMLRLMAERTSPALEVEVPAGLREMASERGRVGP